MFLRLCRSRIGITLSFPQLCEHTLALCAPSIEFLAQILDTVLVHGMTRSHDPQRERALRGFTTVLWVKGRRRDTLRGLAVVNTVLPELYCTAWVKAGVSE